MNSLEDELSILTNTSMETPNASLDSLVNNGVNMNTVVTPAPMPMQTPAPVPTTVQEIPVTNVNMTGMYSSPVPVANGVSSIPNTFNFRSTTVDITKPQEDEGGPLKKLRLTGKNGEIFRIHVLPLETMFEFPTVHVHFHDGGKDRKFNFVCLKDCYGLDDAPCCKTHGRSQIRYIIPVILYPVQPGNPSMLRGNQGELKLLIVGWGQLKELQAQAKLATGDESGFISGDIFATVKSEQFKTFNFTVVKDSYINQVVNLDMLKEYWKQTSTPENLIKSVASVVTMEEYQTELSDYDFREHAKKDETPYGVSADAYNNFGNMQAGPNMNAGMTPNMNPAMTPGMNPAMNNMNYNMYSNMNTMMSPDYQQGGWN